MMQKLRKFVSDNPVITVLILTVVVIAIVSLIITFVTRPQNNVQLSPEEKKLQSAIQRGTKRSDLYLSKVLVDNNGWTLNQINILNNNDNPAMVIMNGETIIMGPGSDFPIETLVNNDIPNAIIDYLYPQKPQWVYFTSNFNSYFPYTQDQVKYAINAFAQNQSIQLNRVIMQDGGNVTQHVDNPHNNNRTELTEFKFTINQDDTVYTFHSLYSANNTSSVTYYITDQNNNTLYSQSVPL